ncbi:hypothetical protein D3C86_1758340 [compost metagenome]
MFRRHFGANIAAGMAAIVSRPGIAAAHLAVSGLRGVDAATITASGIVRGKDALVQASSGRNSYPGNAFGWQQAASQNP